MRDGEDFERLTRFFEERGTQFRGNTDRAGEPTRGLVLVTLPSRTDGEDDVLRTLDEIDRELGRGVVRPDHVVYVTGRGFMCPATEPEEITKRHTGPLPVRAADTGAGKGVRVAVVDTGLWLPAVTSATTSWLDGVVADPSDVETIDPNAIHPYGGHGTFVAGVVKCVAPASRVEVEGVLTKGGAVYESEIVQQLHEALEDDDHPQLISISAGTHTRGDFGLLAFEMLAAAHGLDDGEETLVIAAAGNDGSSERFWPAAFPWVVAVGSVDPDGKVSDFSNVGERWVDVYARGRDHVNAFPKGTYTCYEPPNVGQVRQFDGLAQWSGTSFSTPIVTGLVAARMSATGESAREAWAAVKAGGTTTTDPRGGQITIVGPLD
ncbi:S8 family peptidase [Nocardioides humi]|uniref:S8 family peptidase n=1 Tax=Nocardioides humi TaxID=449461 RepID=UPI0015E839E0|nr:S8/S53 family peptidase [Nocardioides humi]